MWPASLQGMLLGLRSPPHTLFRRLLNCVREDIANGISSFVAHRLPPLKRRRYAGQVVELGPVILPKGVSWTSVYARGSEASMLAFDRVPSNCRREARTELR